MESATATFNALRAQARFKRDKAINDAREFYNSTLVRISALEQDLLGKTPSSHRTIASCINAVLPTDGPFTVADVLIALEAMHPRREWRRRSVDNHISRLRDRGIVNRLSKAKGLEPAQYIRAGVDVPLPPFGDKTMAQVVYEVLRGKSMTYTELAVAMLEAGYETSMTPKSLRHAVGVILRKDKRRFAERGGKWAMIG